MVTKESERLTRYLVGLPATAATTELYTQAVGALSTPLSEADDRLWKHMMRHPGFIPYLDAGLAMLHPKHPLRKRIFIALSVAETQPEYADQFLYSPHHLFLLRVCGVGIRAVWRTLIGIPLTAILTRTARL